MAIVTTDDKHYKNIANAIREKIGNTDLLKPEEIAENVPKVYEKGKEDGRDINPEWTHWDYFGYHNYRPDLIQKLKYTDTSKGIQFNSMFESTPLESIPNIDVSNGVYFYKVFMNSSITKCNLNLSNKAKNLWMMFNGCSKLTEISLGDTSGVTSFYHTFSDCTALTYLPAMDTSSATDCDRMFYNCSKLVTIDGVLDFSKNANTYISQLFYNCTALKNVNFAGVLPIKKNCTNAFATASALTVESLMSIINAMKNTSSSTTYTVTIGSTNLAKLTEEQIAIATAKNIKLS